MKTISNFFYWLFIKPIEQIFSCDDNCDDDIINILGNIIITLGHIVFALLVIVISLLFLINYGADT